LAPFSFKNWEPIYPAPFYLKGVFLFQLDDNFLDSLIIVHRNSTDCLEITSPQM